MEIPKTDQGSAYQIKIKETLDPASMDWFNGLTITPLEKDGTLLSGFFPDQSALRGFLTQLWNLNFTIQSVAQIGPENPQGAPLKGR